MSAFNLKRRNTSKLMEENSGGWNSFQLEAAFKLLHLSCLSEPQLRSFLAAPAHYHFGPDHTSVQTTVSSQGLLNILGSHFLPSRSPISGAQVVQVYSVPLGLWTLTLQVSPYGYWATWNWPCWTSHFFPHWGPKLSIRQAICSGAYRSRIGLSAERCSQLHLS